MAMVRFNTHLVTFQISSHPNTFLTFSIIKIAQARNPFRWGIISFFYVPLKRFQVKSSSGEMIFRQERMDHIFFKGTRRNNWLSNLGEVKKELEENRFWQKIGNSFSFWCKRERVGHLEEIKLALFKHE